MRLVFSRWVFWRWWPFARRGPAFAQQPARRGRRPSGSPRWRCSRCTRRSSYVGRIQATDRVNIVARVTAFIDAALLHRGRRGEEGRPALPARAGAVPGRSSQAKQATVAQFAAQLQNAIVTLQRAQKLLSTPAGQQSTVDAALAGQQSLQGAARGAQAQLRTSQINLAYTEIRAPIDGKIGRTALTVGNVVTPELGRARHASSARTRCMSSFPCRCAPCSICASACRRRAASAPRWSSCACPTAQIYGQKGKLDFVDNTVSGNDRHDDVARRHPQSALAGRPGGAPRANWSTTSW